MPLQPVLVCQEYRIPLPEGDTIVGRGIGCGIRFNTAVVSRRHLRLSVRAGELVAENLSTTTGTMVNGKRLAAVVSLRHGDRVGVGPHELVVELVEGAAPPRPRAATPDGAGAGADSGEPDEVTQLGERLALSDLAGQHPPPPDIRTHTCPTCRARVAFTESLCRSCGHSWGPEHPSAITARVTSRDLRGALGAAAAAGPVPVVYASEEMTLDGTVSDVRADGLFVPTELLDPVGTTCEVTLLPDGHPAVTFAGVIDRVRATADAHGPAGLYIRFTDIPAEAGQWLARRLQRVAP